ncbi:hypothetical protein [Pandoraea sp. CB10b_02]|uniref:hypothetical protein n=1 Tax=Pandoraea sp. CB10b_02 TaxID=2014535 RepID=UPI00257EA076|nr:hypothetical protein [Pandoraea sp. CB10b_02]
MSSKKHWRKLGRIFEPGQSASHPKLISHAANPLPLLIEGDVYRVFFSGRDAQNRSSVGAVDINIVKHEVVRTFAKPFFEHGPAGSFFADGVSIGNVYKADGQRYMLFMGWQTVPDQHWRGDIGRLVVNDDLSLTLDNDLPFMATDATDPVSLSYPWVMPDEQGGFYMWYGSTVTWDAGNGEMLHVLNYATSQDGHIWNRHGLAVPYALGTAQAFSRPTVIRNAPNDGYDMWFSYRSGTGEKYRIGYAFSPDGRQWQLDLASSGIDVSPSGWDADMIEYPFVFRHKDATYMLYNGDGFGKSGFGLAILDGE